MWRNLYPLNYVLLCKTKKIQVKGRSNSSKTTTPSKSLKHRFEVENEFKDDHALEEFKDESEFNDDHAFEEFEVENGFNRVRKFIWLIFIYYKSDPIRSENLFDWSTTSQRSQADRVRKFVRLIFIYYKSEVSDRSGPEIVTDLHLLQIRGLRPTPRRDR